MRPKTVDHETFTVSNPQAAFDTFKQALKQVVSVPKECVDQAMRDEQLEREVKKRERGRK